MDEQERKQHLETLKRTPAELRAALKGVPKKLQGWRPAPGRWSMLEIVSHMRDMERDAYLARYRRILAEDQPALPDIDGDQLALLDGYRELKLGDVVKDWTRQRRESLALLKTVKGAQWQRVGVHASAGALTVEDFLKRHAVGNDAAHLGQIAAIKMRHALFEKLAAAPPALGAALRGISEEKLRRRASEGKWSILENAAHLRDVEQVFAERFTKAAFSDKPAFWMADNDRLAVARGYGQSDPALVVKQFRELRDDTLTLLRALPQAAWQRTGIHPTRGEITIERLAEVLAEHDVQHIDRIRALGA